jgi:rhodanese-related sulfurtransferase
MDIPEIDCRRAHELLQQGAGAVYLDVRTEEEFAEGHPSGALNIPIAVPDRRTGMMALNPEFAKVAGAVLAKDAAILCGCKAGGRSFKAAMVLQSLGFANVSNVAGGWSGGPGAPRGSQLGFPSSRAPAAPGAGYADLRKKAGL